MYSYIKWERSYVSGVKGCKIKINLEMPNDVFSDSPPVRPHAWYYIYGEPHTYTCWPLSLQKPRMRLLPAPCLGGGLLVGVRGCYNFHLAILTSLGTGSLATVCFAFISLGVFTFSFKWKTKGKGRRASKGKVNSALKLTKISG